jgi:pimeloyl-ACP methyl ester carboxylesterase
LWCCAALGVLALLVGHVGVSQAGGSGNELPPGYADNGKAELQKLLKSPRQKSVPGLRPMAGREQVELVFVIDATGSMWDKIANVRANISRFAEYLGDKDVDLKTGLVSYKDITADGISSTFVYRFSGSTWAADLEDFNETLFGIPVSGGGDDPETPIDALGYLLRSDITTWSPASYKFAVLLTDADFKTNNRWNYSNLSVIASGLAAKKVNTSVITHPYYYDAYKPLTSATGGIAADISTDFWEVLKSLADSIIDEIEEDKSEYQINAFGNVIGSMSGGGYVNKLGALIDEQSVAALSLFTRKGFTADGNSRLLIRIQAPIPKTVSLNLDELESLGITVETLDRKPVSSPVTLTPVNGKYQKTVVLIAPESWPGEVNAPTVFFNVSTTDKDFRARDLTLYKPPVVLVHGLNSEASAWDSSWLNRGVKGTLEDNGFSWVHAGEYNNVNGPRVIVKNNDGMFFFSFFITPAMNKARDNGIECSRVDVVAHSMGGLMAKQFALSRYYKDERSYSNGIIRRLITLGTPHLGSGFASYLRKDTSVIENKFDDRNTDLNWQIVNSAYLRWMQGGYTGSALEELSLNSPTIQALNVAEYEIPMFAIVGNTGRDVLGMWGAGWLFLEDSIRKYTHEDLFRFNGKSESSDGVVGVSSAKWEGSGVAAIEIGGRQHVGMTTDSELGRIAVNLLAGSVDWFRKPISTPRPSSVASAALHEADAETSAPRSVSEPIPDYPEKIVLGADRREVLPGEAVKITASAGGTLEGVLFGTSSVILGEGSIAEDADGLGWTIRLPEDFSGVCDFGASGLVDGEVAVSNMLSIVVKPDLSSLSWISFEPGPDATYYEGAEIPLSVTAFLGDGKYFNVTRHELGTTYASSAPAIATVSEDGKLKAVSPGSVTITARNGGVEAALYVTVEPFDVKPYESPDKSPDPGKEPSGSGGGGCSTGLGALAVMTLAGFLALRKYRA